jgi:hypothetical protein
MSAGYPRLLNVHAARVVANRSTYRAEKLRRLEPKSVDCIGLALSLHVLNTSYYAIPHTSSRHITIVKELLSALYGF